MEHEADKNNRKENSTDGILHIAEIPYETGEA